MHDVRVHYDSHRPGRLGARAFAQGNDIHLARGSEGHLPHEAWHVVQQKQERVTPTVRLRSGVDVNDDPGLEREAETMGARALAVGAYRAPAMPTPEGGGGEMAGPSLTGPSLDGPSFAGPSFDGPAPGAAVIQGVWGHVGSLEGERLNLRNNGDGTYTHSASERSFEPVGSAADGEPLIVREVKRRRASEQPASAPERRQRRRTEPSPESSSAMEVEPTSEPQRAEPQRAALTDEELERVGAARTYRFTPKGEERPLYGADISAFRERACWNWALSGGCGNPINPAPLFNLLGDLSHNRGGALRQRTFEAAWNHVAPDARDQRAVYDRHRSQIQALWDRRRMLNRARGRGRAGAESQRDTTEQITNDAVRLAMRMNGLQPAEAGERSRFAIAIARHPDAGVNFSHWGLEVDGHSFETITGHGLWHQQEGFQHWARQRHSIEDSQVTRVPLLGLTPGHVVGIRGLLRMMEESPSGTAPRSGSRTASTRASRRRGASATRADESPASRADEAPALPAPIGPGRNLDAGGMVAHYFGAIGWANAQGTYSAEFHAVRDDPAAVENHLRRGGMAADAAHAFRQQMAAAVEHHGQEHQPYVEPAMQERIMTGLGHQEQLFAVLRYLRHVHGAQQDAIRRRVLPRRSSRRSQGASRLRRGPSS